MKKHLFWIVELFVWLLILITVSSGLMLAKYNYKKQFNTYQIFLPDVDGLINGSPVRMMGIQVGYVNQIDIVGDDVYVKFIVTEKNIKIPFGSAVTVEFSGLGGSKSLEIYPPDAKKALPTDKLLVVLPPKRIHDSLGLLNEMFDKVVGLTYSFSHFMDEVGFIRKNNHFNRKNLPASDVLEDLDNWFDRANEQSEKINIKINNAGNGLKHD